MIPLKFATYPSAFKKNGRAVYVANVRHNGRIGKDEFQRLVARRAAVDVSVVGSVHNATWSVAEDVLGQGMRFDLGPVAGGLVVHGKFNGLNDPWDPTRHELAARVYTKGKLNAALAGLTPVNATDAVKITVMRVQDSVNQQDGLLVGTADVLAYVAGKNLLMNGGSGEGCWLEDEQGLVVATGAIEASTGATLDVRFGLLPAPGEYWLTVAGRNGLAESVQGVSQGRRKVTVKASLDDGE